VEKAEIEGDETSTKADDGLDGPKHVPHESMLLTDLDTASLDPRHVVFGQTGPPLSCR
jgi:hypothetical protein